MSARVVSLAERRQRQSRTLPPVTVTALLTHDHALQSRAAQWRIIPAGRGMEVVVVVGGVRHDLTFACPCVAECALLRILRLSLAEDDHERALL